MDIKLAGFAGTVGTYTGSTANALVRALEQYPPYAFPVNKALAKFPKPIDQVSSKMNMKITSGVVDDTFFVRLTARQFDTTEARFSFNRDLTLGNLVQLDHHSYFNAENSPGGITRRVTLQLPLGFTYTLSLPHWYLSPFLRHLGAPDMSLVDGLTEVLKLPHPTAEGGGKDLRWSLKTGDLLLRQKDTGYCALIYQANTPPVMNDDRIILDQINRALIKFRVP